MRTIIKKSTVPLLLLSSLAPLGARANLTLLEKDDWKVMMGGFVELDMIADSTRSFTEVVGNAPVSRGGTYAGDNGRTQFSIRNSRLGFTVLPPNAGDWKTKGYLEFDLFGFDPAPPGVISNGYSVSNSESNFFTAGSLRVRHAYLTAENNGWQVLAGQYWTLFGWVPTYVLSTASVPPVVGTLYERTPQVMLMKNIETNENNKLQAAISVTRPAERDSQYPGVDAGVRYSMGGRRSGFSSANSDINAEPMSLAVSGTFRDFEAPILGGGTTDKVNYAGYGVAVNGLIPVLASNDPKEYANTLSVLGEYTMGRGYADELPNWSGGIAQDPSTGNLANLNLDPGQGGYDVYGGFNLVHLQTWNAQLQYHLPSGWDSFTTWGYGQLYSDNINNIVGGTYDRTQIFFGNFFHDFSKQIRAAIEYSQFRTHYVNSNVMINSRGQVSLWFRF